jgi:hypothetical protein
VEGAAGAGTSALAVAVVESDLERSAHVPNAARSNAAAAAPRSTALGRRRGAVSSVGSTALASRGFSGVGSTALASRGFSGVGSTALASGKVSDVGSTVLASGSVSDVDSPALASGSVSDVGSTVLASGGVSGETAVVVGDCDSSGDERGPEAGGTTTGAGLEETEGGYADGASAKGDPGLR